MQPYLERSVAKYLIVNLYYGLLLVLFQVSYGHQTIYLRGCLHVF